jgi:hypothetical protein
MPRQQQAILGITTKQKETNVKQKGLEMLLLLLSSHLPTVALCF